MGVRERKRKKRGGIDVAKKESKGEVRNSWGLKMN